MNVKNQGRVFKIWVVSIFLMGFHQIGETLGQSTQWRISAVSGRSNASFYTRFLESGNNQLLFSSRKSNFDSTTYHLLTFDSHSNLIRKTAFASLTHRSSGGYIASQNLPNGYMVQFQVGQTSANWNNLVARIDTLGSVLWAKKFTVSGINLLSDLVVKGADYYACSYPAGTYRNKFTIVAGNINNTVTEKAFEYAIDTVLEFRLQGFLSAPGRSNYLTFETTSSDALVVKMMDTTVVWCKRFKNWSLPSAILQKTPNRLMLTFRTNLPGSTFGSSVFAVLDTNGNLIRAKSMGLPSANFALGLNGGQLSHIYGSSVSFPSNKRAFFELDTLGNILDGFTSTQTSQGFYLFREQAGKFACVGNSLFQIVDNPAQICQQISENNLVVSDISTQITNPTFTRISLPISSTDIAFGTVEATHFSLVNQCITTEMDKISEATSSFKLVPNPATGTVQIDCGETGNMQIFNSLGQRMMDFSVVPGKNIMDISSLSPGYYRVQVIAGNVLTVHKLMVR